MRPLALGPPGQVAKRLVDRVAPCLRVARDHREPGIRARTPARSPASKRLARILDCPRDWLSMPRVWLTTSSDLVDTLFISRMLLNRTSRHRVRGDARDELRCHPTTRPCSQPGAGFEMSSPVRARALTKCRAVFSRAVSSRQHTPTPAFTANLRARFSSSLSGGTHRACYGCGGV